MLSQCGEASKRYSQKSGTSCLCGSSLRVNMLQVNVVTVGSGLCIEARNPNDKEQIDDGLAVLHADRRRYVHQTETRWTSADLCAHLLRSSADLNELEEF